MSSAKQIYCYENKFSYSLFPIKITIHEFVVDHRFFKFIKFKCNFFFWVIQRLESFCLTTNSRTISFHFQILLVCSFSSSSKSLLTLFSYLNLDFLEKIFYSGFCSKPLLIESSGQGLVAFSFFGSGSSSGFQFFLRFGFRFLFFKY